LKYDIVQTCGSKAILFHSSDSGGFQTMELETYARAHKHTFQRQTSRFY